MNAEAYSNRANLHHILGKYDLAIKDYNKAIEFNPNAAVLYSNRGYVHLVRLGHEIKGCLDLQRACKLGECKYYDAAVTQMNFGNYKKAVLYLKAAIKREKQNPD